MWLVRHSRPSGRTTAVCPGRRRGRGRVGVGPGDRAVRRRGRARLAQFGPNQITGEKPPSVWAVALHQLRDPMNIMLVAVTVVSLAIGEVSTGVIVGLLIVLNVVLGSRQELKARASVDALSNLQVPQAKVVRDGALVLVPAVDVVPGDIVAAGGRRHRPGRRADRAVGDAGDAGGGAHRGERPGRARTPRALPGGDVALGDRTNMLFQNTSVTRGTAAMVVTATGMGTQMGQIATMLTSVTRTRSPLQQELDSLTKVLGHHRVDRGRVHRRRRAAPRHAGQRAAAARHGHGDLGHPDRPARVRLRPAVHRAPSSSPRPRRSSRTSPTSRRSARPARSTPTRPAR